MEKTKQYIEDQLKRAENQYWKYRDKLEDKQKELEQLEHEIEWLAKDVDKLLADRMYYEELYREFET